MKTMTDELKPCPFCGGEAKIKCGEIVNRYNTAVYRHYHVECMYCGVDTKYFDTDDEAIEAWNRRVVTDKNVGDKERKKGEWIYDGIRGRFPACKCSICGHYENADWALSQGVNYCPNCGAEMSGE